MQAVRPVQPLALLAHADQAAGFFDLPLEKTRQIFEKACNPAAWMPAAVPGLHLFDLIPGPRWANADAGLIRFEPGVSFPHHSHMGEERVLMLEGAIRFTDGSEQHAGEELIMPPGSAHAFTVLPEGATYGLILGTGVIVDGFGPYPNAVKRVP
jgi:quercetin dioxygenase-like cupin family protein